MSVRDSICLRFGGTMTSSSFSRLFLRCFRLFVFGVCHERSFTETTLQETNSNVLARFIIRNTSIKIPSSLLYLLLINTNIFPPKLPKNP